MAKIDTSALKNYDTLSAEEKVAMLEAYEFDDRSGELEKIKSQLSQANSEAATWKKKHNEYLSQEERAKLERDEEFETIKQELETLKREKTLSAHKARLIELGYEGKLAEQAAKALVDGDTESFFKAQTKFLEERDKQMAVKNLQGTPRPPAGDGGKAMTFEEIMKISDPAERQAKIAENINLFE